MGEHKSSKKRLKSKYDEVKREIGLKKLKAPLYTNNPDFISHHEPEIRAYARALMDEGVETGNIHYAFMGAQMYEDIGKGKKAIPKLLKAAEEEKALKKGSEGYWSNWNQAVEDFIERNTEERQAGESALEGKLPAFIALTVGGIALGVGSLTMTGNVVSNMTQTTPGLLGIILFIAGLTGMFFYSRRK